MAQEDFIKLLNSCIKELYMSSCHSCEYQNTKVISWEELSSHLSSGFVPV